MSSLVLLVWFLVGYYAIIGLAAEDSRLDQMRKEIAALQKLGEPLIRPDERIMFWRPQKVGSSTILSLLLSYSFRYNKIPRAKSYMNALCTKLAECALNETDIGSKSRTKLIQYISKEKRFSAKKILASKYTLSEQAPYDLSISHEVCNLPSLILPPQFPCGFRKSNKPIDMKQIFVIRDPLARIISVYYFWGELFKLQKSQKSQKMRSKNRLGENGDTNMITGSLFTYHGNEHTAPSERIAMDFATSRFPLMSGMPGPSYTWSLFSHTPLDAVTAIRSGRFNIIVSERLDESLVALAHTCQWDLADVLITLPRKALSRHPKYHDWPEDAVRQLKQKLNVTGEYSVYKAANESLNDVIRTLKSKGVRFDDQVRTFALIRARVTSLCTDHESLSRYKRHLEGLGLMPHLSQNRLRDTNSTFDDQGHSFSWNGEILYSYDVCGGCEAHAIYYHLNHGSGGSDNSGFSNSDVDSSPLLKDLPRKAWTLPAFLKCPRD